MLRDFILSVIRTYIPLFVGAGLTWVGVQLDVPITDDMTASTSATVVLVVSGLYYLAARALESRWPFLSFLLATPPTTAVPHYANAKTIPGEVVRNGQLVAKTAERRGR